MRKIKITGKGKLVVTPDITEVAININGIESEYHLALAKSVDEVNIIKKILLEHGLKKELLKTKDFSVYKKTKQVKDQNGNYYDHFLGYGYVHLISFKFDNDNELLGKLLYDISKIPVNPEVTINYLIKDFEKAKNDLLAEAIKDSIIKAKIIAEASNVTLCEIQNIDYSWGTIKYETNDFRVMNSSSIDFRTYGSAFEIDIEPDDIELSDTVTVEWEIK